MVTEKQVIESLETVLVPAVRRNIIDLNMLLGITVTDGKVQVSLASTGLVPGAQDWIKSKTREYKASRSEGCIS